LEPLTSISLIEFLKNLGDKYPDKAKFFLLGGSALCLLGNPRETLDIDYTTGLSSEKGKDFECVIQEVAGQLKLDVESVPLAEFIPLAPDSFERHKFLGRYGNIDVYIFDLYSIALSKLARGFDSDLEDVEFLINN
jgi:hypothetical protein